MHKALIVEDQCDAQQWLSAVLVQAIDGIETVLAGDLDEARQQLSATTFDLALVDLHLPDGWGGDLIREIKQQGLATICIVSTIYDDDEHLFPAIRVGADGYLLKAQPKGKLVEQLRRMLDGEPPLSPSIARRLLYAFQPEPEQNISQLTEREREVLVLVSKGYTLAQTGECLKISLNTVSSHLKKVYRKLEVSTRAEASLEAARLGIIHNKF